MNTTAITPDHVEYVTLADLAEGDVTVHFTAIGVDIDIPPTPRQLRMKRTSWDRVNVVGSFTTSRGVACIDINPEQSIGRNTGLPTAGVWRIRRDSMHLLMGA